MSLWLVENWLFLVNGTMRLLMESDSILRRLGVRDL